ECEGRIFVMIDSMFDCVDGRAVVDVTMTAAEQAERGEEFILSGYQITFKQIFYILNNLTGRKAPKLYIPHWVLKLFVPLVSFFSNLLGKVPTLTSYALYTISINSLFSHEKSTKQLQYYPLNIFLTMNETN